MRSRVPFPMIAHVAALPLVLAAVAVLVAGAWLLAAVVP